MRGKAGDIRITLYLAGLGHQVGRGRAVGDSPEGPAQSQLFAGPRPKPSNLTALPQQTLGWIRCGVKRSRMQELTSFWEALLGNGC